MNFEIFLFYANTVRICFLNSSIFYDLIPFTHPSTWSVSVVSHLVAARDSVTPGSCDSTSSKKKNTRHSEFIMDEHSEQTLYPEPAPQKRGAGSEER